MSLETDVNMDDDGSTEMLNNDPKIVRLTSLPDEIIALCYSGLPADDLISLEYVSYRLHELISTDGLCWKDCVKQKWSNNFNNNNNIILQKAARHAGSWKHLYAEKTKLFSDTSPWYVASISEINSIVDIILSIDTSMSDRNMIATNNLTTKSSGQEEIEPSSPPKNIININYSHSPVSIIKNSNNMQIDNDNNLSMIVLIDASSSVTDIDFKCMKNFTNNLIKGLKTLTKQAYISIVQFNQLPKVELPLTCVHKPKVLATVDEMGQLMGSTDIAAPIKKARELFMQTYIRDGILQYHPNDNYNSFSPDDIIKGDRIIVLITDGQTHADELRRSEEEAKKAFDDLNATVYSIGVGRDINEKSLSKIANVSENGMYFTLRRYVQKK